MDRVLPIQARDGINIIMISKVHGHDGIEMIRGKEQEQYTLIEIARINTVEDNATFFVWQTKAKLDTALVSTNCIDPVSFESKVNLMSLHRQVAIDVYTGISADLPEPDDLDSQRTMTHRR